MESQSSSDRETDNTWANLDEGVKRAVISLRDFARGKEKEFDYVLSLRPSDLGGFLKEFYLTVKEQAASQTDQDGQAGSNLLKVRSDLSSYFRKVMNVDITTGSEFSECNGVVNGESVPTSTSTASTVKEPAAAAATSTTGATKNVAMKKHTRQRTFTFETNELRQIYMSEAMNLDQPDSLQNKVFFDVCMYICNRGKDFLRLMTKNDFELSTDQTGHRYVWLKYDPKFSFNEVAGGLSSEATRGSQIGERMYERAGDPKCPVLSYTQYVIHLHPMSDAFWQRPKRSVLPTDFVWYDNQSIGNSTLNKLMNRITQSAGLPDSYAINAIKSSYIPIIESICRSALFGRQQFQRILHMKHANREMHHVRKRHSEGSLSIASVLRESPLFTPRHSEPHLPLYRPRNSDIADMVRSSSTSPIPRTNNWDSGSPHMLLQKAAQERLDSQEAGYHGYRNCDSDISSSSYQSNYRDSVQNGAQDLSSTGKSNTSNLQYREEERKVEAGSILQAKQKCLDIVHSLEVRDIKSFINWMKTFEVKHGPSGLMVTCQPVNVGENQQQEITRPSEENGINGYREPVRESYNRRDSIQKLKTFHDFEAKELEFDCIGDTFCCISDVAPVKITIPAQDTVLLTGLQSDSQVLIHKQQEEKPSVIEEKYLPLHQRVLVSSESFGLHQVDSVMLRKMGPPDRQISMENNLSQEARHNTFKEEKSIPMKKRIVIDHEAENMSSPQHSGSPQGSFPASRSPPNYTRHSPPHGYLSQQSYSQSSGIPNMGPGPPPGVPESFIRAPSGPHMHAGLLQGLQSAAYRDRFQDGWGYFPQQKRQKFGLPGNNNKEAVPLDLIKQS